MEIYSLEEDEVYEFLDDMVDFGVSEIEPYHREALKALQVESDEDALLEVTGPRDYTLHVQRSEGGVEIDGELPPQYELDFELEDVEPEVEV